MNSLRWQPFCFVEDEPIGTGESCVVAIGVFDGVHRGHQALINHALVDAQSRGVPCVVLTFDPDPAEVVGSSTPSLRLMGTRDRIAALHATDVSRVVTLDFTQEMSKLSPETFVGEVICKQLRPVSIHVGDNFRFGYQGVGMPQTLADLGKIHGFVVNTHELLSVESRSVSSTRIRELLLRGGCLDEANELLGRCHYVRGTVIHGRGEATSFGFPTANVECDANDCLPAEGVYACYVSCDGRAWPAAVNVGAPPSFDEPQPTAFLEANLIGFEGNLYDAEVCVSFVRWLRPSRRFDSLEELEQVVLGNIDWVRTHLGDHELSC